jgi:hypothetical protein
MKDFLEKFSTSVSGQNGTFTVQYENGEYKGYCKYVSFPKTKYQKDPIYLLTECEMGDVIEWRHKNSPLTSDELTEVSMEIRFHSLYTLTNYLHIPDGK